MPRPRESLDPRQHYESMSRQQIVAHYEERLLWWQTRATLAEDTLAQWREQQTRKAA